MSKLSRKIVFSMEDIGDYSMDFVGIQSYLLNKKSIEQDELYIFRTLTAQSGYPQIRENFLEENANRLYIINYLPWLELFYEIINTSTDEEMSTKIRTIIASWSEISEKENINKEVYEKLKFKIKSFSINNIELFSIEKGFSDFFFKRIGTKGQNI